MSTFEAGQKRSTKSLVNVYDEPATSFVRCIICRARATYTTRLGESCVNEVSAKGGVSYNH